MADKWMAVNIGGKVIWKNATTGEVSEKRPAPPAKRIKIRKPKADADPTLAEVLSGDADLATDDGDAAQCGLEQPRPTKGRGSRASAAEFDDPLS